MSRAGPRGRLSAQLGEFAASAPIGGGARERARIVLADTMIAILSGRRLAAGTATTALVEERGSGGVATQFATFGGASAELAAFVNGTLAHADETDDSHEPARMHPACSIVPAALAAAEAEDAPVATLLDAIAVGYDAGVALNLATWTDPRRLRGSLLSTHHIGGLMGSVAACLRARHAPPEVGAVAFSYAVQHAGGCTTWLRDTEHVEKGVVFGGLPARSALFCVELAGCGFSGVEDPFGGPESFFDAFGHAADPEVARSRLAAPGRAIGETCLKRYPVGMPIQAACEALERLLGRGAPAMPDAVLVELPAEKRHVVDDRGMGDINLQHVMAVQLVTGRVDFAALHGLAPLPGAVADVQRRVRLVGSAELDADRNPYGTTRVARVTLRAGVSEQTELVAWPVGTPRNPMSWDGVERKSREVLGACGWSADRAADLVATVRRAGAEGGVRALTGRLAALGARH